MKELTPEKQREITFNACRAYNLHLRSSEARRDIVYKLAEVAEYLDEEQAYKYPQECNDLRILDNEYIASYYRPLFFDERALEYITFHRESGITSLNCGIHPKSNRDWKPSYNNLLEFEEKSLQSDGSIRDIHLFFPQKPYFKVTTISKDLYTADGACPCYSNRAPLPASGIKFQPSGYDGAIYNMNTGLPIVEKDFTTTTLDSSNSPLYIFTPSKDDPENAYYLSWHYLKQTDDNGEYIPSSYKCVELIHKNKQAFLNGDEPLIIVFENINGHDEVYRRLPSGSYIVNSSVVINHDDSISYDDLSYQEIVDRSETLIRPQCDIVINTVKGNLEKVISQEYLDLFEEIINKDRHDKTKPEDDEPIY